MTLPSPDEPPLPETIDSAFRSGSLTAIGVVAGFSLSFLSSWASQSGPWTASDLAAVIAVGIGLQIKAVAGLLQVSCLQRRIYERQVRYFLAGFSFVAIGVGLAIFGEMLGFTHDILRRGG